MLIRLWLDTCIAELRLLKNQCIEPQSIDENLKLTNLVHGQGEWQWNELNNMINYTAILYVAGPDSIAWRLRTSLLVVATEMLKMNGNQKYRSYQYHSV